MSTIKGYAKYLHSYDHEYFFLKEVKPTKHIKWITRILTDEATNANFTINGANKNVPRHRYEELVKKYKRLEKKYMELERAYAATLKSDPISEFLNE
jgi:isocitrate dehydrogenase kinase/phosphatase